MLTLLDYIFYRVTTIYKDRWHASSPKRFGMAFVVLFVMLVLFDIYIVIDVLILKVPFGRYTSKPVVLIALVAAYALTEIRYHRDQKFEALEARWIGEETHKRRWRVALVWLFVTALLAVAIFCRKWVVLS